MKIDRVDFIKSVSDIVSAIPKGKVSTYGDIAALAGYPSYARLVGKSLASIGMDSAVPCHRVVNAQGRPAPHWHSQSLLLAAEGIRVGPNGRVNLKEYRWQPTIDDL